jgi:hypothetical protein
MAFPYIDPLTAKIRTLRFRPDKPLPVKDDKSAKYLSPKGARNFIYFPPNVAERLKGDEIVYVVEGEFKALMAWQYGLFCVGLPGVWSWRGVGHRR